VPAACRPVSRVGHVAAAELADLRGAAPGRLLDGLRAVGLTNHTAQNPVVLSFQNNRLMYSISVTHFEIQKIIQNT